MEKPKGFPENIAAYGRPSERLAMDVLEHYGVKVPLGRFMLAADEV